MTARRPAPPRFKDNCSVRYVILRDDDTNALTPVDCLERLYRPFLERGLPVNLATIPEVSTTATMANGEPEGFLLAKNGEKQPAVPIAFNKELVRYILGNPGYHVVQHGCHHDYLEFRDTNPKRIRELLDCGASRLSEAGFPPAETFVAPYDKFSRTALLEVQRRFKVVSSGWYEFRGLPSAWLPRYALKKLSGATHWRVGQTLLLTHPGCLLSFQRSYGTMLEMVRKHISARSLTILVTHWWEYFRGNQADEPFIGLLHEVAEYLASSQELKVASFAELASGAIPLGALQ
jgi:hypothetical protein